MCPQLEGLADAKDRYITSAEAARRHARRAAQAAGLRQVDVAKKLGVPVLGNTFWNSGQRRVDVVELIELGRAIGFDPAELVKKLVR